MAELEQVQANPPTDVSSHLNAKCGKLSKATILQSQRSISEA